MDTIAKQQALKGGEFLIRETKAEDVFIPEEFSEEQRMMAEACQDFIDTEITPNVERMDSLEEGFMASLLDKAGELGLLAVTIPEEYGGLGMSFNTSMLMADMISPGGSFSTAFGAHTGIGTLPIQYYGDDAQKAKYLLNWVVANGKPVTVSQNRALDLTPIQAKPRPFLMKQVRTT